MSWRNCEASLTLVAEVDACWPNRDRSSDGTIGNAAHQAHGSNSDHNPWMHDPDGTGIVRARDIDEDLDGNPANGPYDARALFDHLLALAKAGDPRLNGGGYLIYEGHIYSERGDWTARPYHGPNAHEHHVHVSFSRNRAGYDSTAPWGIYPATTQPKDEPLMVTDDDAKKIRAIFDDALEAHLNPDGKGSLLVRIRDSVAATEARVVRLLGKKG